MSSVKSTGCSRHVGKHNKHHTNLSRCYKPRNEIELDEMLNNIIYGGDNDGGCDEPFFDCMEGPSPDLSNDAENEDEKQVDEETFAILRQLMVQEMALHQDAEENFRTLYRGNEEDLDNSNEGESDFLPPSASHTSATVYTFPTVYVQVRISVYIPYTFHFTT